MQTIAQLQHIPAMLHSVSAHQHYSLKLQWTHRGNKTIAVKAHFQTTATHSGQCGLKLHTNRCKLHKNWPLFLQQDVREALQPTVNSGYARRSA